MAQGRGFSAIMSLLLCMLVLYSTMAHANTYIVGDKGGWTFNTVNWPKGKSFKAGDVLVFNYDPSDHNTVIVDKAGYDSCVAPQGSKSFQSGHDQIPLAKGTTYFICTFPGHCQAGMKIAVTAA